MRKLDPVKHEEKRRLILEAAGRCFARSGFRGASISDICAEAGISPGHLYHYFASKEAIVGAMAEARLEGAAARFAEMIAQPSAVAALIAEIDVTTARHGRVGQLLVLDMLAEAGRNPAMASILEEHSRGVRRLLADFLSQCQARGEIDPELDPELAAGVLLSVIDGSKTLTLRDPGVDIQKSLDLLKTLITRFLMPPG
ncbi:MULTISPECIES: TetR/AcrR family transcriptional regulator [Rhodomicrobium]|uniref:TetR/AcrR family transcriptional regulator n=1 Tax=Rhodomicrobium TaxID=1068 RepID=UPI000B4AEBB9|nr:MULTISPECIES: TetR/AcrR family transcriptional regulator [Rhodomicrobium]